ncbi:MAG: hypothetical protein AAF609_13220 [Cyanobacteria bacterium P01_C01_bin.120]
MTQDITRWLTEIRTLQQQLEAARKERDQAYQSAANWRKLYDAEAKQWREEVAALKATEATLRTELSTLRSQRSEVDTTALTEPLDSSNLQTVEGLRAELIKALQSCDRLEKALDFEQRDHAATRRSLTAALGETIDALNLSSGLAQSSNLISEDPEASD